MTYKGEILRVDKGVYASLAYSNEVQTEQVTEPPPQGLGPQFRIEDGALDQVPSAPKPDEAGDALQQQCHERLKERISALSAGVEGVGNQFPQLQTIVADYRDAVSVPSISDIDVPTLFMIGIGLIEHANAFKTHDPDDSLTPPLEPELLATLGECARLHGTLITGFEEGQRLSERAGFPLMTTEELSSLLDAERELVRELLGSSVVRLTDGARNLFSALQHELDSAAIRLEQKAYAGFPAVRNTLIVIAGVVGAYAAGVLAVGATLTSATGLVDAWLVFLNSQSSGVLGFAANFPELREYFSWLYARLDEVRMPKTSSGESTEDK